MEKEVSYLPCLAFEAQAQPLLHCHLNILISPHSHCGESALAKRNCSLSAITTTPLPLPGRCCSPAPSFFECLPYLPQLRPHLAFFSKSFLNLIHPQEDILAFPSPSHFLMPNHLLLSLRGGRKANGECFLGGDTGDLTTENLDPGWNTLECILLLPHYFIHPRAWHYIKSMGCWYNKGQAFPQAHLQTIVGLIVQEHK